jgi:hypothetical protein
MRGRGGGKRLPGIAYLGPGGEIVGFLRLRRRCDRLARFSRRYVRLGKQCSEAARLQFRLESALDKLPRCVLVDGGSLQTPPNRLASASHKLREQVPLTLGRGSEIASLGELRIAKRGRRGKERLHISGVLADKPVDRAGRGSWLAKRFQLVCFSTPALGAKLARCLVALPRKIA